MIDGKARGNTLRNCSTYCSWTRASVQRHEDLAVEGSEIRRESEGEIDGVLRHTDIINHQIELVGRNDLANLLLNLAEEYR